MRHPPQILPPFPFQDKLLHALVYALLAILFRRALRLRGPARLAEWTPWVALLLTSAYGASDETHQWFVPGRQAEVLDWVADSAGGALALALSGKWTTKRAADHANHP